MELRFSQLAQMNRPTVVGKVNAITGYHHSQGMPSQARNSLPTAGYNERFSIEEAFGDYTNKSAVNCFIEFLLQGT